MLPSCSDRPFAFVNKQLREAKFDEFSVKIGGIRKPTLQADVCRSSAALTTEIEFNLFQSPDYQKPLRNKDKVDDNALIALFRLLSLEHLLNPLTNDSNSPDKGFTASLLHIIGLTETAGG